VDFGGRLRGDDPRFARTLATFEEPGARADGGILDSRTLQSTPESGSRGGYDGAKRKKGSKVHPDNLASQLPEDLADPLRGEGGRQDFSVGESYERVAQREGVGADQATQHARAVALVLQEAVTTGEVDHVRDQLKDEYAELFGRKGE